MKASLVVSIFLFAVTVNALHIPADVSMERRGAMSCVQASSCNTLFRRGKGPKPRPVALTPQQKRKAANDKFQVMKNHVLHGKDARNQDEASDKGRHTLTAYCKANPKATGECSTETHLCHVPTAKKSLWDDREGRHTHAQIEDHCTDAILHHTKNPSNKGHVVETAAGHHICIKYTSGNNNHGTGTCHHAGVNVLAGHYPGDVCERTGNTATEKKHVAAFNCSGL